MNHEQHVPGGVLTVAGHEILEVITKPRSVQIGPLLTRTVAARYGSLAADWLEPACHPHHRKSAHSVAAGAVLLLIYFGCRRNPEVQGLLRECVSGFALGYLSHLVLDACTPYGIPLV
jgi:membrane-bound metal-dependent hydrolase YbcI (DUF457 family)